MAGYTVTASPAQMSAGPLILTDKANGGPIASVSVGNSTSGTLAVVYPSSSAQGAALYTVPPGQFITLPLTQTPNISIAFVLAPGAAYDGSIFVHTDPTALATSGFNAASSANAFATTLIAAASAVICPSVSGTSATFLVGVVNNCVAAQPVSLVLYDSAATASGFIAASIGLLGPTQIITWPPPGRQLFSGCVALASGIPMPPGIEVLTR